MRPFVLALLALVTTSLSASAQEPRAGDLTANDLAEALGVHWWIVKLPAGMGPKDGVGVEVVSSDGKVLEGPSGFSGPNLGGEVRIYCHEDKTEGHACVSIQTKRGTSGGFFDDYFKYGGIGGVANGTVLKVDDILIKFSKGHTIMGGNAMLPGDVGLKVVITRHP